MSPRHLRAISATESQPSRRRPWVIGPISLFIAATVLFCLVCLSYLWLDGQITTAHQQIYRLLQTRDAAWNENQRLTVRAQSRQSASLVQAQAVTVYHMVPVQPDQVQWVDSSILAPALVARRSGGAGAALASMPPTRAQANPLAAWWQAAGQALGALFR